MKRPAKRRPIQRKPALAAKQRKEKALRMFVRWYDEFVRDWPDEIKGTYEYYDLQAAYDAAKLALSGALR